MSKLSNLHELRRILRELQLGEISFTSAYDQIQVLIAKDE